MADIHINCEWKRADDGIPLNPLQALASSICGSSKDFSINKFDAYLYGICVGWDDKSYKQLKKLHNWSDETVEYQKTLHRNFIKAWQLLTDNGIR